MINVEIGAENYKLDDELRSRAIDRIGGLDELMSTLDKGRVEFSWVGGTDEQPNVFAKVWGGGEAFEASIPTGRRRGRSIRPGRSSSHRSGEAREPAR